jgi:hypothetical protein
MTFEVTVSFTNKKMSHRACYRLHEWPGHASFQATTINGEIIAVLPGNVRQNAIAPVAQTNEFTVRNVADRTAQTPTASRPLLSEEYFTSKRKALASVVHHLPRSISEVFLGWRRFHGNEEGLRRLYFCREDITRQH